TLQHHPEIRTVIVACQGDCSYTQALGEILEAEGRQVIHFKFPYPRNREQLAREIGNLRDCLGASEARVAQVQERLAPLRRALQQQAEQRRSRDYPVRLGFAGIPPIFTDLWEYLEELGAGVVFHEFPRQFSMPHAGRDLAEQYFHYTYPYEIAGRLVDLLAAVRTRRLDGLVHYTQSFCFRQMFDQTIRERLNLPILTIEGDRPAS